MLPGQNCFPTFFFFFFLQHVSLTLFHLFSRSKVLLALILSHTQGAEVTGQLRVNGKVRHLRRCTLEDQSLALKRKHRVHKYVNTATICVPVMNLFILT